MQAIFHHVGFFILAIMNILQMICLIVVAGYYILEKLSVKKSK